MPLTERGGGKAGCSAAAGCDAADMDNAVPAAAAAAFSKNSRRFFMVLSPGEFVSESTLQIRSVKRCPRDRQPGNVKPQAASTGSFHWKFPGGLPGGFLGPNRMALGHNGAGVTTKLRAGGALTPSEEQSGTGESHDCDSNDEPSER